MGRSRKSGKSTRPVKRLISLTSEDEPFASLKVFTFDFRSPAIGMMEDNAFCQVPRRKETVQRHQKRLQFMKVCWNVFIDRRLQIEGNAQMFLKSKGIPLDI